MENNRKYKEPSRAKSSILQYCVVGLVCLPFLIGLAFWFNKIKLASWIGIVVYCCVILFAWFIWVLIRNRLERRAERIRAMRKENEERMKKALANERQREQNFSRNSKKKKKDSRKEYSNVLVMQAPNKEASKTEAENKTQKPSIIIEQSEVKEDLTTKDNQDKK